MNQKQQIQQLCSDFLGNKLKATDSLELLSFLGDTDLESIVMRYAHGDCHAWSLALHEINADMNLYLLVTDDSPIHSFIFDSESGLALDSNGVHKIENLRSYWSAITGDECEIEESCYSTVYQLCNPYSGEIDDAMAHIIPWYEKTRQHFLK